MPNTKRDLQSGMFIEVRLATDVRPEAVVIAEDGVLPLQGSNFVWVVVDGKAVRRQVELGVRTPGFVEVRNGVEAGEQVVVGGQERLAEGAPAAATVLDRTAPSGRRERGRHHPIARWRRSNAAGHRLRGREVGRASQGRHCLTPKPLRRRTDAPARHASSAIYPDRSVRGARLADRSGRQGPHSLLLPPRRHARLYEGSLRFPRRLGRHQGTRSRRRGRVGRRRRFAQAASPRSIDSHSPSCPIRNTRSCARTGHMERRRSTARKVVGVIRSTVWIGPDGRVKNTGPGSPMPAIIRRRCWPPSTRPRRNLARRSPLYFPRRTHQRTYA